MASQHRVIDEYEALRRRVLDRTERTTLRVTLALRAVMDGGMVSFMQCCITFLSPVSDESQVPTPIRRASVPTVSAPSQELTHALTEMALTIVCCEVGL